MNNTPDSPAKPPDDRTDQGGNYWTLFTPGIWKVLHAVLHNWLSHCRSIPGLDELQARLSALMPYRVAADLLQHVLPINAGTSPETLRSHTLQVGRRLGDAAAEKPPIAATAITIRLDSTFIRSRDEGERHLEVRVGNVETVDGGRQVFGAVTRAETDITALIKRTLETVGRTDATEVTAFTDGCPGLRAVLANARVMKPPLLDWFLYP